ncbi:HET-domain-containing protein [Lophiostoma macrostomum CBS 122681]|uniref:HET-domain-containing protein n=1 Tax=Lophiostoma macrostomum CBS 122681 TaxID=1314788 RepID=A0A6A6SNV4_9PLEO|nr:HET-domain-containing protein [Lophiostoma macrostomum CBS 122681]
MIKISARTVALYPGSRHHLARCRPQVALPKRNTLAERQARTYTGNRNAATEMTKTSSSTALGYRCLDIPGLATPNEELDVSVTRDEIRASAASGCSFCTIIEAIFLKYNAVDFQNKWVSISARRTPKSTRLYFQFETLGIMEVLVQGDSGCGIIPRGDTASGYTGSQAAYSKAEQWFQCCLNSHLVECQNMANKKSFVPTRLLHIGTSNNDKVVLTEKRLRNDRKWACLSHCWGGSQLITTTRATIAEYKQGIPWGRLPRTFKDAIEFTRRLELEYLWIDSLCIIQDDDDDWRAEASQMADIYRNSTITLSAAASEGPDGGFYREAATKEDKEIIPGVSGYPDVIHRTSYIPHSRRDHILLTRAWVMQERLLSPRVLHFGVNELIWECMQESHCECGGIREEMKSPDCQWHEPKSYGHPEILGSLPYPRITMAWRDIVREYSRLGLTKTSDVFPAISGTAKVFRQALGRIGAPLGYIAGLWEGSFLMDCLWYTFPIPGRARPEDFQAPTFSWASVSCCRDQAITYNVVDIVPTYYSKLLRYHCALAGKDEMGPVTSGYAVLQGSLVTTDLHYQKVEEYEPGWFSASLDFADSEFLPDYDLSVAGVHQVMSGSEVSVLRLVAYECPDFWDTERIVSWSYGLTLRRLADSESIGKEGVYERIGLLQRKYDTKLEMETWWKQQNPKDDVVVRIV